jgi:hypothetical protein
MSKPLHAAIGAVVLLLCPLVATAQRCPTTLTPLINRYETSPPFTGLSQLRMAVTFRNETTDTLVFVPGDTFQWWGEPTGDPPVVINSEPVGSVAPGATFSYDLTFDLSGLSTTTALAFRVEESSVQGVLDPDEASVVSAEFTCSGTGVPDLGRFGLMVLAMAIVAAAVWRLRAG